MVRSLVRVNKSCISSQGPQAQSGMRSGVARVAGWDPYTVHESTQDMFPWIIDLYSTDPAQLVISSGEDLL